MIKTFTLLEVSHQINTDTEGTIIFHVTDENNVQRSISARSILNEDKSIKGAIAISKREVPLVENLFKLEINDSVKIEFDGYNRVFDRDENKTINQKALDVVNQIEEDRKFSNRIKRLLGFKKNPNLNVNLSSPSAK